MNPEELKERSKKYALRIIKLTRVLPRNREGNVIGSQLIRCGTSVASNYRAVCRARSKADFISKMGIVIEEADECLFWFELIVDLALIEEARMKDIQKEGNELLSTFISSAKTAKKTRAYLKNNLRLAFC